MEGQGLNNRPEFRTFRRELRNGLTPAEAKLWSYLKHSGLEGRKFRRQHSISGYILDFFCPSERLAIELDGQPHLQCDAIEYDRERDLFMARFGVKTLRIVNAWVFENPRGVLSMIRGQFGWYEKK